MAPPLKKKKAKKKKSRSQAKAKALDPEIIESEDQEEVFEEDSEVISPEIIDLTPEDESSETDSKEIEILSDEGSSKALAASDPVARYLAEIRKYPLLDRDEERRIAEHYYETGDPKSAEILVTSNLRFVVKIAAEYSKFGAKLIDLIQEGNVGLMQGVKEFNPYKGVRLISYAVWWIRGYISEYLMRQYSLVRIGTTHNQRKLFYQLQRERDELERLGMEAGIKQLSGRLGIPEKEIRTMNQRLSGKDVSLSTPVGSDDSNSSFLDLQSNPEEILPDQFIAHNEEVSILRNSIDELRPELNEKELFILDNRILSEEPMTLQEIGDKNGTTREAVRQMEARLLKKIKEVMTENT